MKIALLISDKIGKHVKYELHANFNVIFDKIFFFILTLIDCHLYRTIENIDILFKYVCILHFIIII